MLFAFLLALISHEFFINFLDVVNIMIIWIQFLKLAYHIPYLFKNLIDSKLTSTITKRNFLNTQHDQNLFS